MCERQVKNRSNVRLKAIQQWMSKSVSICCFVWISNFETKTSKSHNICCCDCIAFNGIFGFWFTGLNSDFRLCFMSTSNPQSHTLINLHLHSCLVKENAAPQLNETTPEDTSTPHVQPVTVYEDSPVNASDTRNSILEFENNEHNRQVLDELFDLLLEVSDMTGE